MAIEISNNGATIGVGLLPGRKSHCLYTVKDGLLTTVAYFQSEADGNHFLTTLALAMGVDLMWAATVRPDDQPPDGVEHEHRTGIACVVCGHVKDFRA